MINTNSVAAVKYVFVFLGHISILPGVVRGAGVEAERMTARRTVAMLPAEIREFYQSRLADLEERVLEPESVWESQSDKRGRQSWHHLRLDAAAKNGSTSARLAAAEAFPRKEPEARKLYKSLGMSKDGGRLPWAIEDLSADLTRAFEAQDADEIVSATGYLAHFAWDASQPFSGSVHHDGRQTGNLHLGNLKVGERFYAHQSVEHRVVAELVRRNRNRYLESVRVLPIELKPASDPVEAVFAQMIGAAARLEDLLSADREILAQLGAKDGESFAKREDEYYQMLDARCGDVIIERIQAAAVLSANLVAASWERAGRPPLNGHEPPPPDRASAERSNPDSAQTTPPERTHSASATPAEGATPQGASGEGCVGSGKSAVYHRPNCEHARKISASNLVRYASTSEAESQGKRACRVCKPK